MDDKSKDTLDTSSTDEAAGNEPNGKAASYTVPAVPAKTKLPRPKLKLPSYGFGSPRQQRFAAAAVVFVLAVFASGFGGAWLEMHHNQNSLDVGNLSQQKQIVTSQSQLISQIAQTVGPSVVSVNVNISSTSSDQSGLGLLGFSQPESEQAAGTGIIVSSSGYIITNRHVVPDGTTSAGCHR